MPGDTKFNSGVSYFGGNLTRAVLNGSVPEWRLNDMATRIMAAYFLVGQDPKTFPATNFNSWTTDTLGYLHNFARKAYGIVNQHVDVRGDHGNLIREIGAKSTVLLKNENNTLPLVRERSLAIFGSDAGEALGGPNGCSDRGCHDGTLAMGWGSGASNFPYLVTPLEAIKARALADRTTVASVLDDYAYGKINATARAADKCLVFVASDAGEGYINFDGNMGDRRKHMGVLFQSGALFTDLDVFENVAFPLRVHTQLSDEMIRDIVLLKLQAVGLRGAIDLMPDELSGGMKRRVALARAIALDPQILMYDEPFVGQDPIAMGVLVRLIRLLNDALGITSIVVSHDLAETASIADYLYVVGDGQVLGQGTPQELMNADNPRFLQDHGRPRCW